ERAARGPDLRQRQLVAGGLGLLRKLLELRLVALVDGVDLLAHVDELQEPGLADDAVRGRGVGVGVGLLLIALDLLGLAGHLVKAGLRLVDLALGPPGAHAHDAYRGGRGQQRGAAAAHGDLRSRAHRSPPEREYTRGGTAAAGVEWGFAARRSGRAWRIDGTDVARRSQPDGPGRARGGSAPGDGQGGAAARRHRAPPRPDVAARRGDGGPGRDLRPDRRHRRRALRRERPREAARVGQRDRLRRRKSSLKTVGLVSLGCPKNLVDGEVMLGRLQGAGYALVPDAKQADVIVVNTCAFIDRAKQESVDAILEMAREKETGRAKRLVVTGCLSERYDAELRREIPEIDATLGTGQVEDILRAVDGEATTREQAGPDLPSWVYDHTQPRVLSTPPWLAYVKISEGCDYTCSFCIIPKLRGRHRSRSVEDIVNEARALAARGVREIVLVAQDSTRYGLDHGVRDGLAYLLRRLGRVDGIRWIRIMYAYPSTLSDKVLDAIASEDKVVKYVDIPLQHASEPVLKRMKRPTGKGNLLGMVERI